MNRSKDAVKGISNDQTVFFAAFVGAGGSNMTKATNTQFPLIANLGSTATRTSQGLYVVTLTDITPQVLDVDVNIFGTSTFWGKIKVAFDTSTKICQINVFDQAGNLADPTTNDTVVLKIWGRDSTA